MHLFALPICYQLLSCYVFTRSFDNVVTMGINLCSEKHTTCMGRQIPSKALWKTSLFTQVPIDEALEVVEARLTNDPWWTGPASQSHNWWNSLDCLRSTYFQFQNEFFEQINGTPMGSPLFPIIANLFMENLAE